jgi:hypothetical protein
VATRAAVLPPSCLEVLGLRIIARSRRFLGAELMLICLSRLS